MRLFLIIPPFVVLLSLFAVFNNVSVVMCVCSAFILPFFVDCCFGVSFVCLFGVPSHVCACFCLV